jgi:RHS repeat-associated protein
MTDPSSRRTATSRLVSFAVMALALLIAAPVKSSTEPSNSRGFSPDQAYHVTGIDSVNDFTGNLGVTIPIGPTFKSNGTLTYAFTLRYNSNLWDYREHGSLPTDNPRPHWADGPAPTDAFPIFDSNAGLGWRISVGGHPKRHPLGSGGLFVTDSGAEHSLASSPVSNTFGTGTSFTNDTSYLRVQFSGAFKTVEYPDGIRERFVCVSQCSSDSAWWDLDQRSDPFGNILYVIRGGEPSNEGGIWTWTYKEAVGSGPYPDHITAAGSLSPVRQHTVEYTRDNRMTGKYDITRVVLASPGAGHLAEYKFVYTPAGIIRPFTHSAIASPTVPYGPSSDPDNLMPLTLLTGITVPKTPEGASSGDWAFHYITDPEHEGYPGDVVTVPPGANWPGWKASHFAGLLDEVTLPTAGKIQYKYTQRRLTKLFCVADLPDERARSFTTTAVRERAILRRDGAVDGTWRYISAHFRPGGGCSFAREQISAVLDPFGNLDVSYFSIFMDGTNPNNAWTKYEWGIPITKEENDGAGRYLQTRKFHCTDTAQFEGTGATDALRRLHTRYLDASQNETLSCGDPVRSNFVQWESDSNYCRGDIADCDQTNRRVKESSTVYHDDGGLFTETINDDYDGLGHYRSTRTGGNFYANTPGTSGIPGGDERITFIGYNPGLVFLNHNYVTFPNGRNLSTLDWVLGTYELKKTAQARNGQAGGNAQVAASLYRFNSGTGFLERERTLRRSVDCAWNASTAHATCYNGNALDAADLFVDHVRTQSDTLTSVTSSYYGGDGAGLAVGSDLNTLPGGSPDYILRHDFRFGGLEASGYYDCTGTNPVLMMEQNTVDPSSGLVTDSTDDAGATTSYVYDHLGRYKSIDPPGTDAATSFTYTGGSSTLPATIVVDVGTGGALRKTTFELDHLGRVAVERNKAPIDALGHTIDSIHYTGFFANGWKSYESTIGPEATETDPVATTVFRDFDPFGRPQTVLHPDNKTNATRKTTYQYAGDRMVIETVHGLALGAGNGGNSVTTRFKDRFGRLVRVTESSGADGAQTATRYEYDNLDHIVLVAGTNSQRRRRGYDMRGLLVSESGVELGDRTIRYSGYDARGNVTRRLLSRHHENPVTPFDVSFGYDGAERITSITQNLTGHLLKTFEYFPHGTTNPALSAGKLHFSTRHNWTPPATSPGSTPVDTTVTEEMAYNTSTGRMSKRTTSASGLFFATSFNYDGQGNVSSIVYPKITGCTGCAPARTVSFSYTEGKLAAVPGFASSIAYAANAQVTTVTHGNGTTDQFDYDTETFLPRPSKISTTFTAGAAWDTGDYSYDAAGNVSKIGNDFYAYDQVGRLVKATLSSGLQNFTYDAHGNLDLALGGTLKIDPKTNRLPASNAIYDAGGNLVKWTDPRDGTVAQRDFDPFNQIGHNHGAGQGKIYLYDASEERVAVLDYGSTAGKLDETWSIRGLGSEVLRDFKRLRTPGPNEVPVPWSWRDNVYRSGTLLARIRPLGTGEEVQHLHVDHLGTVRRTSGPSGTLVDSQDFLPFGRELNETPDDNRLKFTGHERDAATLFAGEVDYMHARFYSPTLSRFLSVDPAEGDPAHPQSWNRYVYGGNNPISHIDPDGRADAPIVIGENIKLLRSSIAAEGGRLNPSSMLANTRGDRALVQFQNVLKADSVRNIGLDAARTSETISPEMFGEFQADAIRVGAKTGDFSLSTNIQKIGAANAAELDAAASASIMGKSIPILGAIATFLDVATVYLNEAEPIIDKANRAKPPRGGWQAYEFMLLLKKLQAEEHAKELEEQKRTQTQGTRR